jgi:hypothetical protein
VVITPFLQKLRPLHPKLRLRLVVPIELLKHEACGGLKYLCHTLLLIRSPREAFPPFFDVTYHTMYIPTTLLYTHNPYCTWRSIVTWRSPYRLVSREKSRFSPLYYSSKDSISQREVWCFPKGNGGAAPQSSPFSHHPFPFLLASQIISSLHHLSS